MSYTLNGEDITAKEVDVDSEGNIIKKAGIGSLIFIIGIGSIILYSLAEKTGWVSKTRKIDIRKKRKTSGTVRPLP